MKNQNQPQPSYLYFEIGKALMPLIKEHIRDVKAGHSRLKEFLKTYGVKEYMRCGRVVSGLIWPKGKEIPDGWRLDRRDRSRRVIVPNKRSRTGREAAEEMAQLANPLPKALFAECGVQDAYFAMPYVYRSVVGVIRGRYFLKVGATPETRKIKHPALKPIKNWEMTKLEEEVGELMCVA